MLWSTTQKYNEEPFETEAALENAIKESARALFGEKRIYIDVKKRIGIKGKTQNIPDGYLIDLTSNKDPRLYVVEVELARHDPIRHVAVQILEFSLSFETSPQVVKAIVKEALTTSGTEAIKTCVNYATSNGFDNLDYLLERIIFGSDRFNALVIIDELSDELERVLISKFKFPVEVMTFERFRSTEGDKNRLYKFEPFLEELVDNSDVDDSIGAEVRSVDVSELDTVIVPAREDGFRETFLNENRWYAIRIHATMIPRIKYIATYRVAPDSAITHIGRVSSIEQWKDTNKYLLNLAEPAKEIDPIPLVAKGKVKAPQAPRYTTYTKLMKAKTLDEVF